MGRVYGISPAALQMPMVFPWRSNTEALGNGMRDNASATTVFFPAIFNEERRIESSSRIRDIWGDRI